MKDVRDKVAGLDGWVWYPGEEHWEWADDGTAHPSHPIPDTLDACAAAWDRHAGKYGWKWERHLCPYMNRWEHQARDADGAVMMYTSLTGHDAAYELRDRWALLGEVLKARGV